DRNGRLVARAPRRGGTVRRRYPGPVGASLYAERAEPSGDDLDAYRWRGVSGEQQGPARGGRGQRARRGGAADDPPGAARSRPCPGGRALAAGAAGQPGKSLAVDDARPREPPAAGARRGSGHRAQGAVVVLVAVDADAPAVVVVVVGPADHPDADHL